MGTKLYFTQKGVGMPLVLLHGNGESSEYFAEQTEFFSAYYRVIAIDTRGHGKSPRGDGPFSLERFSEDLKEFLDELKIRKAIILGFSDGANIALLFALRYPGYVEKLILNGGNLNPGGVKLSVQLPVYAGYLAASAISPFNAKAAAKKEMLRLMAREPHISERDLQKIDMPVLVIAGTNDMIKHKHTLRIHRLIKGSWLSIIKGDHFIAYNNSREFNKAVYSFLTK